VIRWHLPPEGADPWQWPWGRAADLADDKADDGVSAEFKAQSREFMARNDELFRRLAGGPVNGDDAPACGASSDA